MKIGSKVGNLSKVAKKKYLVLPKWKLAKNAIVSISNNLEVENGQNFENLLKDETLQNFKLSLPNSIIKFK